MSFTTNHLRVSYEEAQRPRYVETPRGLYDENLILLYEENITSLINEEMATNLLLRQTYNDEMPFIAISS